MTKKINKKSLKKIDLKVYIFPLIFCDSFEFNARFFVKLQIDDVFFALGMKEDFQIFYTILNFHFRRLKLSILYPATTGRNFDEILRVIDSLQLTAEKKVATPADWQSGGSCMVVPSVKPEEVAGLFPKGVTIHDVPRYVEIIEFIFNV